MPASRMKLSLGRKVALGIMAAGVVTLGAFALHKPKLPTHPSDAVPASAFLSIDVNVEALRRSPVLSPIFGDPDEQSLTQLCGFDPVDKMSELVFVVPEGGTGDFGVAVEATLSRDDLVRCANEVVKAHGGDPSSEIVSHGSYDVLTPRSTSADSQKPSRSLAFHSGSPILVGQKAWLMSMIDALDDAADGHVATGEHGKLRKALAASITPSPTFLVTVTALLEKSVRDKLKDEMLAQVGATDDPGTAMMLGVLGMTEGAAGLYERGSEVRAVVDLTCETEPECAVVEKLVTKVRGEWAKMPELRLFGPVLDHLEVDHHGTTLELRAGAPSADVTRWGRLLLASKPMVGASGAAGATVGAVVPGGPSTADVPTQTIKIKVPDGLKPGDPFTVRIPSPVPGASSLGVRELTPTVPPTVHSADKPSAP
jgi:hypothetical protein